MEAKKKVLLFLCNCGTNIANFIDMQNLEKWAKEIGTIEVVKVYDLLCAPRGKEFYKNALNEIKPDTILIGACSPKMHETTFQNLASESGINLSAVNMANIREQCAWVTKDKNEAGEKAKAIINAALERSAFTMQLEKRSMKVVTDVCIIGGGIAGIEAAITASTAGRKVYIIDKEISLGGQVIKMEEVAPQMECSPCLLAPRLAKIKDDPNITVISNAEVEDVVGFYGNYNIKIRKRARFVDNSCIGCEACFSACPVSVKSEFHLGLGTRKAIYTLFPGSLPQEAIIDRVNCKHFIDNSCSACVPVCPFNSINFDETDQELSIDVGAIVLATGCESANPFKLKGFGDGLLKNVYTMDKFERLASSNGPTAGKIFLPNGEVPSKIAIIHCAGSLREDSLNYCSRICCISALKVGELIKKQNPIAEIYNIHNDLVLLGPSESHFLHEQQKKGTKFLKCDDLTTVNITEKNDKLKVEADGLETLIVDMVVLSTGLKLKGDAIELAKLLNVDFEKNGFLKRAHSVLHETGTSLDGIYVTGTMAGPCDASTSITRSHACMGDILSKLVPGREIELEMMTSFIDETKCGGCKLCITVCPYKAVTYDKENNICTINEVICRGCGTCTASCPSGASQARHYTDKEIYAEIGGILNVSI